MELREVIGRRRSIRFLLPYKPVEPAKIQRMLEAARIASHWGNVQSLRAVVVMKESAPQDVIDAITAPVAGFQIRLAPVVIVWYLDTSAIDDQSNRLRELLAAGALGFGEGKQEALEKQLIPIFDQLREGLKQPGLSEIDCGQGIAQATLMAFEQGLGTCCLGTPNVDKIRERLGLPDHCRVLLLQTVGYPAESPEAGGQRPRQPFEQLFHLNGYGKPFPRDAAVVDGLTRDAMLQDPAPLPWREAELEYLKHALGIKGHGLL
ncbi:nitroreductase family protein [Myxococcota bacterium]|nr:nitroreductase family protein [Myxococcota bacterium]MCZ7618703.1 nitroreductase family protein [Myxococcota bacterium]